MSIVYLNLDCRELGHVECDALITDPPYLPHVHDGMASAVGSKPGTRKREAGFAALGAELQAYVASQRPRRWSLVYTDVQGIGPWEDALGRAVRTIPLDGEADDGETDGGAVGGMPWVRWSQPQLSGDRPCSGSEYLVTAHAPGRMRWNGPGNLTSLRHKCLRGLGKHPTEKPLDQALDLVSWFTDPGELVYDPCAGSGTLGLACALLGRSYLGCELDFAFWDAGNARLAAYELEQRLSARDEERLNRWLESIDQPRVDLTRAKPYEFYTDDWHHMHKGKLGRRPTKPAPLAPRAHDTCQEY